MVDGKARKYSGTTIHCQSNTCRWINQKFRWSDEQHSGARKYFIKLGNIRDSKQDSLPTKVSVSREEDEHIFNKNT